MPKFNDLDMKRWKETDIMTDSLWIIEKRASDKLSDNKYHGNFVPQIPYQFIKRYTKENDVVLDVFAGSGTTIFEGIKLNRNIIGIDIKYECIKDIKNKLLEYKQYEGKYILYSEDSTKNRVYDKIEKDIKELYDKDKVNLVILHPPYHDIIKFSNIESDLSNSKTIEDFLKNIKKVIKNTSKVLEKNRYAILVIGDAYKNSEWIPLSSLCMQMFLREGFVLKSSIIKNISGNRAKVNREGIWRYRALSSDYYIFKHEYIYVFKYIGKNSR